MKSYRMLGYFLKQLVASIFFFSGAWRKQYGNYASNHYLILTYHRVLPKSIALEETEPGMFVTPETFGSHLSLLKKFFEVLPLSCLSDMSFLEGHRTKPICFITFDDGWFDLYEYAFPLIRMADVPITVFLPIGYIGSRRYFWSDIIFRVLTQSHRRQLDASESEDPAIRELLAISGRESERISDAIEKLKTLRHERIEQIIELLSEIIPISRRSTNRLFINGREIDAMKRSGLVEFGSHTVSHRILTTLNRSEVAQEVKESFRFLKDQQIIDDNSFIPFCYPNGNYNAEVIREVKAAGYHAAVTTLPGWNTFNTHLFVLRRVSMHEDMTKSTPLFLYEIFH